MGTLDAGWTRRDDGGGERRPRPLRVQPLSRSSAPTVAVPCSRARSIHFQVERVLRLFDVLETETAVPPTANPRAPAFRGHSEAQRAGVSHGA
jgi:hypothetical protein